MAWECQHEAPCHAASLLHRCFDGISELVADEEVMGIEVSQPPVIFLTPQ